MNMTSQFPYQRSYKGNGKNFQRNNVAQVLIDGVWVNKTLPCGSKQVVHNALQLEKWYGMHNVRIVKI